MSLGPIAANGVKGWSNLSATLSRLRGEVTVKPVEGSSFNAGATLADLRSLPRLSIHSRGTLCEVLKLCFRLFFS